ncbi:cell wall hydrolase [Sphingomonas parva]|uniref:Cell wall hydrolase n=1 Tax=Sphingomonas parva TaxID=2555898 RepID=A0A4Y8ZKJ0_9SPHN|nr:cell wall hydrolase [Sphingomonas parva]
MDRVDVEVARPSAPAKQGLFASLWTKAATWLAGGTGAPAVAAVAPQRPLTLDELVANYAGDQTVDTEQDCLAKAVYFEARGEPLQGQLAVAEVVMNRAASGRYPASLCEVITQPWQFSFIHKGRFPTPDFGSESWRKAVAVARIAQGHLADTLPGDVLWYHADYVSPSWGKRLTKTAQIGLHIFYS